jgi:hypothetical protein
MHEDPALPSHRLRAWHVRCIAGMPLLLYVILAVAYACYLLVMQRTALGTDGPSHRARVIRLDGGKPRPSRPAAAALDRAPTR